jgi:hypothetical protein
MFSNITVAALFTIAIASSLIAMSSFAGSAHAVKKAVNNTTTNPNSMVQLEVGDFNSSNSPSANTGDSSGTTGDSDSTFAKNLKKFSKCLTAAAANGDLTLVEVTDCYHQVF